MGKSTGGSYLPNAEYAVSGGVTRSSTAYVIEPTETGAVSTQLSPIGNSTITTSTSGVNGYTVGGPITRGYRKSIACITASTSAGTATVTLSTGTYDGSATIATFTSGGYLELLGVSASRWAIIGVSTGTVAFT